MRISKLSLVAYAAVLGLVACGGGGGGANGGGSVPVVTPPVNTSSHLHVGADQSRGALSAGRSILDAVPSPTPTPSLATLPTYGIDAIPEPYMVTPPLTMESGHNSIIAYLTDGTGSPLGIQQMPNPTPTLTWTVSGAGASGLAMKQVPISQTPEATFPAAFGMAWLVGLATTDGQTVFTAHALDQTAATVYNVYRALAISPPDDQIDNFGSCVNISTDGHALPVRQGSNCDIWEDASVVHFPYGAQLVQFSDTALSFSTLLHGSLSNPVTSMTPGQLTHQIVLFKTADGRFEKWYVNVIGASLYGPARTSDGSASFDI